MPKSIEDAKILIVATNGFEYSELTKPRDILAGKGASVTLASLDTDEIQGESGGEPQGKVKPDTTIGEVSAEDFDALVLPGGVGNPDTLRMEKDVVRLIQAFDNDDKPVAAICHAPWLLIEADLVDGKTATSWPSVRTDLANAGANVVDQEVAVDGNIITSRNPDDIPAFTDAIIEAVTSKAMAEVA